MDAQLKAKWVEALRGDEYQQGQGSLLREGCYCCLGVLCEVADVKIVDLNEIDGAGDAQATYKALTEMIGGFDYGELVDRNDGHGHQPHSFAQLADWIESHIPSEGLQT